MNSLTPAQTKEIEILVRLGDSLELATKTVLEQKDKNNDFYRNAYES